MRLGVWGRCLPTHVKPVSKLVHINYAPGESGWAKDLGDGRYQIDNIPLTSALHYGDIIKKPDGPLEDATIFVERLFPNYVSFEFYSTVTFFAVAYRCSRLKPYVVCEGYTRPQKFRPWRFWKQPKPGLAAVCFNDKVSEHRILGELDIYVIERRP